MWQKHLFLVLITSITGTFTWKTASCSITSPQKHSWGPAAIEREINGWARQEKYVLGTAYPHFHPSHLKIWWERVRRKKKARLLTGKVHIPSPPVTWSSSLVGAMQCPGRNTCPPALPPSLPWQSPFPISLLHRAVQQGWPKQRWIESTSSCLWAGCGAGSKGQWAGCWSPALMLLVLAEEPWAGCCCGEHSEPSPGCTEGLSCGTSLQHH